MSANGNRYTQTLDRRLRVIRKKKVRVENIQASVEAKKKINPDQQVVLASKDVIFGLHDSLNDLLSTFHELAKEEEKDAQKKQTLLIRETANVLLTLFCVGSEESDPSLVSLKQGIFDPTASGDLDICLDRVEKLVQSSDEEFEEGRSFADLKSKLFFTPEEEIVETTEGDVSEEDKVASSPQHEGSEEDKVASSPQHTRRRIRKKKNRRSKGGSRKEEPQEEVQEEIQDENQDEQEVGEREAQPQEEVQEESKEEVLEEPVEEVIEEEPKEEAQEESNQEPIEEVIEEPTERSEEEVKGEEEEKKQGKREGGYRGRGYRGRGYRRGRNYHRGRGRGGREGGQDVENVPFEQGPQVNQVAPEGSEVQEGKERGKEGGRGRGRGGRGRGYRGRRGGRGRGPQQKGAPQENNTNMTTQQNVPPPSNPC